jgi:hypothetical protein
MNLLWPDGISSMVSAALRQDTVPTEIIAKYGGVMISSAVGKIGSAGSHFFYKHPCDPLARPRQGDEKMMMVAPASLGLNDPRLGMAKLCIIVTSVAAAEGVWNVLKKINLQLLIGKGIGLTPAPEKVRYKVGVAVVEEQLSKQVAEARTGPLR